MNNRSVIEDSRFWQVVEYLSKLDGEESLKVICERLDITAYYLETIVSFLKEVNYKLEVVSKNDELFIIAPLDKLEFKLNLSLLEWLSFQAHFPAIATQAKKPFHNVFASVLSKVEDKYNKSDLFEPLSLLNTINKKGSKRSILEVVEKAILLKNCLSIETKSRECLFEIFPHRLVHLESNLSLICEDFSDNCLSQIRIDDINDIKIFESEFQPKYSALEVESFISNLRSMSDNTVRLILRIHCESEINLNPKYQFLDNSTVVMSPDGDKIWASTVEINDEILQWLHENRDVLSVAAPSEVADILVDWQKLKAS